MITELFFFFFKQSCIYQPEMPLEKLLKGGAAWHGALYKSMESGFWSRPLLTTQ